MGKFGNGNSYLTIHAASALTDVVSGDLTTLRGTGGDFGLASLVCRFDDHPGDGTLHGGASREDAENDGWEE